MGNKLTVCPNCHKFFVIVRVQSHKVYCSKRCWTKANSFRYREYRRLYYKVHKKLHFKFPIGTVTEKNLDNRIKGLLNEIFQNQT